ncbi:type II toxin-antitoxin system PemK/MazF family toxin [Streptomyces daliensis]|uniref:Type II toxin-antitoxin system PemK/MazF family toxin n=1 Tax=Streptomyces daliensis TaxID=299421 RepID=A0A8T4IXW9_9ACTN|nr:type II toxin-antitoxin system PemK/MazF family toxin [Streptomyces daliensis]
MHTAWWLALGAVVALALVAAFVDGRGRLGPRRSRRSAVRGEGPGAAPASRAGPRPLAPDEGPRPGEIWRARVPWGEGPGSDRPCLVLTVRTEGARVARITTRRRYGDLPGALPLPPGSVGDARGRPSYLRTDALREVPLRAFQRRVGEVDPLLWDRVRHLAE